MRIMHTRSGNNGAYIVTVSRKNKEMRLILPSPLDLNTRIMNVPPLRKEHISGSVRIMMRSTYPGNPDNLAIDFEHPAGDLEAIKRSGGCVTVFSMPHQTLEAIRTVDLPIIPGISIMTAMAGHDTHPKEYGILVSSHWMEITQFENGIPITSVALPKRDLEHLNTLICDYFAIPDLSGVSVFIVLLERDIDPQTHEPCIEDNDCKIYNADSLPERVSIPDRYTAGLFLEKAGKKSNKFIVSFIILALLNLLFFVSSLEYRIKQESSRLDAARGQYAIVQNDMTELQRLKKEAERRVSDGNNTKPVNPNPYIVLSELSPCLATAHIHSFTLNGLSFQITGQTRDSLQVLSGIAKSTAFTNVTLSQSVPSNDGTEVFGISGEVAHDH